MKRNKVYERSLFRSAYNLPYDDESRAKICRSSKGDFSILQRMGLLKSLPVHSGCVNTIAWNETGQYLLSGSDDQHLVISDAFSHKVVEDFKTSHRANIFSAKFLPCIRDSRIVSASGDGVILYTDLMSSEPIYKPFNCHCGTAYEVATVPLDPHSFLSCGEDGTVRWYDLRIKESCNKPHCQEDVLVQCQRAVTAMAVNVTAPFELAIGCSDSTVRIFDRRMLGTQSTGMNYKLAEPLCAFTVPTFKRAYRITSLCFSPEGEEILVSYSSDDLYLFSLRGKESTKLKTKTSSVLCKKSKLKLSASAPTPVRRLRLRGDWSDTGPDARPERDHNGRGDIAQARPTLHTPLMQHLTNVISRLLNDPATRAALTSGVDDSEEGSQDAVMGSTSQEPLDGRDEEEEEQQQQQQQQVQREEDGANLGPANSLPSTPPVHENPLQQYELFGEPGTSYNTSISHNVSVQPEEDSATFEYCSTPSPATPQPLTEYKIAPLRDPEDSNDPNDGESSSGLSISDIPDAEQNQNKGSLIEMNALPSLDSQSFGGSELTNDSSIEAAPSTLSVTTTNSADEANTVSCTSFQAELGRGVPYGDLPPLSDDGENDQSSDGSTIMYAEAGIHEHDLNTLQSQLVDMRDGYIERHGTEPGVSLSYSHLGTNTSMIQLGPDEREAGGEDGIRTPSYISPSGSPLPTESPPESPVIDEDSVPTTVSLNFEPIAGPSRPRLSPTSYSEPTEMYMSDYDSDEDEEDLRRELRSRISPPGSCQFSPEIPFPEIRQQYTGHRNARTMIKEATFWGKDYVMSGSDCGHVFVWDRSSAKLAMLLQADQHVVNCLQPHPTEALLATSGIDHDIKLWAPIEEESRFDQVAADEIMKRNALMLEETRDTITVPASFMIRMVACLNQIRRGGRSRSRRTTQESQDE